MIQSTFPPPQYENVNPKFGEIRQFENNKERDRYEELAGAMVVCMIFCPDNFSEYYAIIKATESLEMAFSRDAITPSEYAEVCTRLISQFKTTGATLLNSGAILNADSFFREYELECPRAYDRLVRDGVPATVMHGSSDNRAEVKIVAETVQAFITAMDALRLDQRATDEVQPLISELVSSLGKVQGLPFDFEGIIKMKAWLQKLNQLRASDEIGEDDARQLSFDLENSYNSFHQHLGKASK